MLRRYRVFKKDGTYEVAACHNRFEAVKEVKERYHLTDDELDSVTIVSSKNTRLFKL